jgi:mRNA interferase MazF
MSVSGTGKLRLRIVVPITEWSDRFRRYSWMIRIEPDPTNGLSKRSAADAFQVRSLAVERFRERLGVLPETTLDEIAAAVALCVGFKSR